MAKHSDTNNGRPRAARTPVMGRTARIGVEQARSVRADEVRAGDVLITGVVLMVTIEEHDVRFEMPGSDVHFLARDEPVTVLARVDRGLLDAISVTAFTAAVR